MPAPYRHIDLPDRRVIFRMINEQRPIEEIAERTGFHRSTIYREIGRNKVKPDRENRSFRYYKHHRTEGYFPVSANERALARRQRQRKLVNTPDLLRHVTDKLKDAWSPQQIAGRLAIDDHAPGRISHETIYQYAYSDDGRAAGLSRLLPKARKRRRPRFGRKPRQSPIPAELAIQNRPEQIEIREEFGHWEGDLMIFKHIHGKTNLSTIIERRTRYTILLQNPDRKSEPLVGAIQKSMQDFPHQACKTITFDRGTEFASYRTLHETLGTDVYFCDPHSPWQKGGVENTNGRIRRFLPGETNLNALPAGTIQTLAASLNDTPRKCLGYRTPRETFTEQLAKISNAG